MLFYTTLSLVSYFMQHTSDRLARPTENNQKSSMFSHYGAEKHGLLATVVCIFAIQCKKQMSVSTDIINRCVMM